MKGLLTSVVDEAEVTVDNFGTYARVPTLVAQRLRPETYESPALPLSYSATDFVLRSTRVDRTDTCREYLPRMTPATRRAPKEWRSHRGTRPTRDRSLPILGLQSGARIGRLATHEPPVEPTDRGDEECRGSQAGRASGVINRSGG